MEIGADQPQEFAYFVVIDFEATCDDFERGARIYPQEIIEFPSVLVNGATAHQEEEAFRTYVRPVHHPRLTDFCRKLTGIQQHQVDGGVPLSEALRAHDAWLEARGVKNGCGRFAVVTWGDWDCRTMLEFECRFKRIAKPEYFDRWINLQVPFEQWRIQKKNDRRSTPAFEEVSGGGGHRRGLEEVSGDGGVGGGGHRRGLEEALRLGGLSFEGRPHSGLDDSRNIARLLTLLMRGGVSLTITGSLPPQPQPQPQPPAL